MARNFSIMAHLGLKSNEFTGGLQEADDAAGGATGAMGQKFLAFGAMAAAAVAAAMVAATAAVLKFAKDSLQEFAVFEKGMLEVFSLLPDITEKEMGKMTKDVLKLSREMGILTTDMVPALYQAISAGVPKENVIEFMRVASKAAIAGVTTLETAVDGLTSVINAYGKENMSAEKAADILFTTVRLGKTTFEELSASLYNVTPVASAVGISFEDVGAAVAALTAQGVPTAQATTQIRSAILSLTAPSDKARKVANMLGLDFEALSDIMAKPGGLKTAMELVMKATGGNMAALKALLGRIEGVNGVLALSKGNFSDFTNAILAQGRAAGAHVKAYDMMNQGLSRQWDMLKTSVKATMIEVGQAIAPLVADVMPVIQSVANYLASLPFDQLGASLKTWMDETRAAMLPLFDQLRFAWFDLMKVIGPLWEMIKKVFVQEFSKAEKSSQWLIKGVTFLVKVFELLLTVINPLINALVKSDEGLKKTGESVEQTGGTFGRLFDKLSDGIVTMTEWIQKIIDFANAWGPAQKEMLSFGYAWEKVKATVMGVIADIVGGFDNLVQSIAGAIGGVVDSVTGKVGDIWGAFEENFPRIAGIVESLTAGIRENFGAVFDFIKGKLGWIAKAYEKFTGKVISLEEEMNSKVTGIEERARKEREQGMAAAVAERAAREQKMYSERTERALAQAAAESAIEEEKVAALRRAFLSMGEDYGKVMGAKLTELEAFMDAAGEKGREAMSKTAMANEAQLFRMEKALIKLGMKEVDLKKLTGEQLRKLWMQQGEEGRKAYEEQVALEKKLAAEKLANAEGALANDEKSRLMRTMNYEQMLAYEQKLKDEEKARAKLRKDLIKQQSDIEKEAHAKFAAQQAKRFAAVEQYLLREGKLKFRINGMTINADNLREAQGKFAAIQRLRRLGEFKDASGKVWKFETEADKARNNRALALSTLTDLQGRRLGNNVKHHQLAANAQDRAGKAQAFQVEKLTAQMTMDEARARHTIAYANALARAGWTLKNSEKRTSNSVIMYYHMSRYAEMLNKSLAAARPDIEQLGGLMKNMPEMGGVEIKIAGVAPMLTELQSAASSLHSIDRTLKGKFVNT